MSWFRRKKLPETEIITNEIPMSTVARWYLYDTCFVKDLNELAEIVGLSRISEEGDSKEREDSQRRMTMVGPLMPYLDSMAEISARVMTSMHAESILDSVDLDDKDDEQVEEILDGMYNIYKATALSTLIGTFSIALELGLVQSSVYSSDTYQIKKDDYDE